MLIRGVAPCLYLSFLARSSSCVSLALGVVSGGDINRVAQVVIRYAVLPSRFWKYRSSCKAASFVERVEAASPRAGKPFLSLLFLRKQVEPFVLPLSVRGDQEQPRNHRRHKKLEQYGLKNPNTDTECNHLCMFDIGLTRAPSYWIVRCDLCAADASRCVSSG